ncbi:DUF421 domain-containing protein [Salipaludibacillus aurantiacus]|uniref:DUF421 domain-containing protein n=1 Tax=Salipaludibacillus aurantiacus TaxID=1601833 RepID=A0A1H9Q8F9_9BACI|nr:YetF domain-containing protein [Salipaludibacillus aurantiacus]SER56707.1 Protein of unknown function [Salipaludibacillus aurantiacus]
MLFDDWSGVIRITLMGAMVYPAVIFMLRISGKRTLSKMNMFDLVITVALGSTVATILLSPDVTFAEGATALALLILLQFLVTWFEVRSKAFTSLVKGEPQLLYYEGQYMDTALKKERVKTDEVRQAVRSEGILSMDEVEAVVLETDGSFSVIKKENAAGESSLKDVRGLK